jgi:dTDP-glucose 4,6-dehydratase
MARVLVTGGAGFIGVNFIYYWLEQNPDDRVVVLDALTYAGNRHSLEAAARHANFRFLHGDICDLPLVEKLLRDEQIDTIVHFAAESHVDRSIVGPTAFVTTNIVGTHNLLEAARHVWLDGKRPLTGHRFHHVSTDEVYGSLGVDDPAFSESTPYAPNSPYAASKAASDHLVRAYHHTYGLQVTISNCSNNFGAFQFPEKLIPLMMLNALQGKALPVYGDGQNVRDWLYVTDHCRAIGLILESGAAGETYNVGGGCELTNIDVVQTICDLVDDALDSFKGLRRRFPQAGGGHGGSARELITYVSDRPGHDRRYAIDHTKITSALDYEPAVTFKVGMAETLRWYLEHESWWQAILDQSYREWIQDNYGQRPTKENSLV